MSAKGKYFILILSSVIVLYSVIGGMMGRVNAQDGAYPQISIFTDVIQRIQEDYVDEPDIMAAMEGAIRGMVESVDPNGGYLSPEVVRFYESYDPIETVGIGAILIRRFDYPVIVTAIPGGAAAEAELGTGDTIEAIDGESLREHNLVEVNQMLSGAAGSTVELTVIRRNAAATEQVTLTRAPLTRPEVEGRMIESQVGHVRIPLMAPGIADDARMEVDRLIGQGARGIVLDLRNAGGGGQDEAIALASIFLDSGTLGYFEGQTVERENLTPTGGNAISLPVAVLVNEGTAGAAEIAAGAIRDNDRGPVVGVRTFGAAVLRRLLPLDDGWALLLAVANYYTPDGDEILTEGIRPTVEVAPTAQAEDPLAATPAENGDDSDRQLERAIEVLLEESAEQAA